MTRSIKTILVSLNRETSFKSNMAMATLIASRYDSHIIGLYVIPSTIVFTGPYGFGGPINMTELNRFYRAQASVIEDSFKDFVRKECLNAEWRSINSNGDVIADTIIEHGREADLVILGDVAGSSVDLQFEGRVAREIGRPVLFVPSDLKQPFSLDVAIIGWDGSREAARAAFDGVPLLRLCGEARVTCFNAHKERGISGDTPGSELAGALARHDVNAVSVSTRTRKSIANALVETAKKADLLVIGAYGHTRLRENIFGGVTNTALSACPCPVLMSN